MSESREQVAARALLGKLFYRSFDEDVQIVARALAACALEAEKPLVDAATALLVKLDAIEKATAGAFVMAHIHGMPYKGPNWAEEYKAMRAALERAAEGTS